MARNIEKLKGKPDAQHRDYGFTHRDHQPAREHHTRVPPGLPAALVVANHYLRPSSCPVEVIDPNDEFAFGDGPATAEDILNTTTTVLAAVDSGEHVEATECGSRVTAEGSEYFVTIDDETPEHLVDIAAHAIVSAIHLQREAGEAMNRAVVALALMKPAS